MLERGAPVWSGVYGTGSSLQHAAQLQLLSQQQMLRQQELLMIQQHTAQVLELQRNAQLVVSGPDTHTHTVRKTMRTCILAVLETGMLFLSHTHSVSFHSRVNNDFSTLKILSASSD